MNWPLAALKQGFTRQREMIPGTIVAVRTGEPVVALTFDDGPHPEYTPRLLEVLRRHEAAATFFMIGEPARRHSELVELVAKAGHAIGNHTWDHPFLPSTPSHERRRQIRACAQALKPFGQRLFRPPYGAQSLASCLDAFRFGYKVILWNVEAKDWLPQDPEQMADRLVRGIRPGSIVLLHDAIYKSQQPVPQYNREPMLAGLNLFLERMGRSFRFVTVPELLHHGRRQWEWVDASAKELQVHAEADTVVD